MAHIDGRGRIYVPKRFQDLLKWRDREKVTFESDGNTLVMQKKNV